MLAMIAIKIADFTRAFEQFTADLKKVTESKA